MAIKATTDNAKGSTYHKTNWTRRATTVIYDKKKENPMRTLDLFAGVGGMRLGFELAGFETIFGNDVDAKCKQTYDLNFKKPALAVKDIWHLNINELPEFDVLLGGFPCQAFSIAGYRKGFKDEKGRGNLFFRIAEIIDERKPKAFILENVKNLKSHDNGKTFSMIMRTLEKDLKYHVRFEVLNSMTHANIPQNRERIFLVGFKNAEHANNFEFPKAVKLTRSYKEFTDKNATMKYYYDGKPLFDKIRDTITSDETIYQWRRKYVRANKKGVCPTLTANMGRGGHNVPIIKTKSGIRKLTPKECFLLQGFPQHFKLPNSLSDSELYHQAGNSVTVELIKRIALKIKETMNIPNGQRISTGDQIGSNPTISSE